MVSVDETLNQTRCQGKSPEGCVAKGTRCLTHDLWDELGRQIYLFLSSVSVADVANKRIVPRGFETPVEQAEVSTQISETA